MRLSPGLKWEKLVFTISMFLLLSTMTGVLPAAASEKKSTVTVAYFYMNPCASCKVAEEFTAKLDKLLGDARVNVGMEMYTFNTFHQNDADHMKEFCDAYGVPEEKRRLPLLFMNGLWLQGDKSIEEGAASLFLSASDNALHPPGLPKNPNASPASDPDSSSPGSVSPDSSLESPGIKPNESRILYFSAPACKACEQAEKVLTGLNASYPVIVDGVPVDTNVTVQTFSLGDSQNAKRIGWYFTAYGVPEASQTAPIFFYGNKWISGDSAVSGQLLADIAAGKGLGTRIMPPELMLDQTNSPNLDKPTYSLPGVLATGLLNGLNPCSLAMMLFFLSLLAVRPGGILKAGILFATGKFIGFCLLGILFQGLFSRMQAPWFQSASKVVLILLAGMMILLNLNDFRAAGKESYQSIRLQLPKKLRGMNHRWLKKVASLEGSRIFLAACLILGLIVSIGDFLCTGQIYLATILYVMQSSNGLDTRAILTFLGYGIAFVTPLLVLTFLVHRGREVFDVSEWVRRHMPAIKLVNACFFVLFGVWVVFFW